ncbi:MAG: hypothetical protein NC541_14090 [bacterium]|nr:hypothetical protein [bacterium]
MSRNLEKEYREYMAKDAPDLWGRIEGGLEPKRSRPVRKGLRQRNLMWGMAAACLCLAVTGFALRTVFLPGFGEMSAESGGMYYEAANKGSGGSQYPEAAGNGPEGSLYQEAPGVGPEGNLYDAAPGVGLEGDLYDAAPGIAEGELYYEAANSGGSPDRVDSDGNAVAEMPGEEAGSFPPNGSLSVGGQLQVYRLQVRIEAVWQENGETVYTAQVWESEELPLQAGDQIVLYDGRTEGGSLEAGAECQVEVSVIADADGAEKYRISSVK